MRLQCLCALVLVGALVLTTTVCAQTTLEKVNTRGKLVCGVNTGLTGFASRGPDGMWRGFDVDYCRALAAAIFNDASKVEFRPLSAQDRFTALQSGEIDVLPSIGNPVASSKMLEPLRLFFLAMWRHYDATIFAC